MKRYRFYFPKTNAKCLYWGQSDGVLSTDYKSDTIYMVEAESWKEAFKLACKARPRWGDGRPRVRLVR